MNADFENAEVKEGQFVLINTGNIEDEDNAKLFVKGVTSYNYLTDLSGATGMTGPQGPEGPQGPPGEIAGLSGIATTEEAIAGVVDNKAMTPLKTKEAIESLVPMQRLIDLIYPVGSIYMSVNSTSPADLFGGTWEAMPAGRVLLAQGTSEWGVEYKAGSTGGEHEHQLSVGEIPRFTPTGTLSSAALTGYQNFWSVTWSDGGPLGGASGIISQSTYAGTPGWVGASTGSQKPGRSSINASHAHKLTFESIGGDSAHNIMQPYLSVFMWKRTA